MVTTHQQLPSSVVNPPKSPSPPSQNLTKQPWSPSSPKLPCFVKKSPPSARPVNSRVRGSQVRVRHAVMVHWWVPHTVACILVSPRPPRPPAPARSPSPRRLSLSIPIPLGSLTPNVPFAKPTVTVWIPPSPITNLWVNYYVLPNYVV